MPRRGIRVVLVALVVVGATLTARLTTPSDAGHFRFSPALACGVER
jgi:hypothetical protein